MSSIPRLTVPSQAARGPLSQLGRQQASRASASLIRPSHLGSSSSFSSSSTSSIQASPPTSAAQSTASGSSLTWDKYLTIRKQKNRAGFLTTIPTTAAAIFVSGSYFMTQEVDPSNTFMGIDPVFMSVGETIICGMLGWLIGPTIGSRIWSIRHSKYRKEFDEKDQIFYQHILARRCDPSRQNMQNRPIDFYGEKIGSIKEYRQWLRDQAAYSRKAAHGVEDDMKSL